jgi:hypothetical protein
VVFNTVAIQLLHTILAEQAEWESRCFIETETECVNESLKWQSTTLYNTDNMFWDDEQAYTNCLNDSSRHTDLCACTRSELVQWDHRSWTDVSECWSRRWVVQWALSNNLQETKIISHCSRSESIHNKMLLEQWRKLLFHERHWVSFFESLCTKLIQYTHDSTMTEHLKRNVTYALLSWQFFWPEMLQNVCTFCQNCDKCCTNNSWKDHWQSFLKPLPLSKRIWQKIFIDFVVDLLSSEGYMNLLIITDCLNKKIILKLCKNMTAEWVAQTFILLRKWLFVSFLDNDNRLTTRMIMKVICTMMCSLIW